MTEIDIREQLFGIQKQLENATALIKKEIQNQRNIELILKFKDYLINRQCSLLRVKKYLVLIRIIAKKTEKDLDKFTKDDIDGIMAKIRLQNYKPSTMNDFTTTLYLFYRHLNNLTDDAKPEICKHLKKAKTSSPITREMLLTVEDVNKMISLATNTQDKCILSLLYDSALRPSELRGLCLKDVSKDEDGYKLNCDGKTGRKNAYPIVSESLITEHLNNHISKEPNSPLFYLLKGGKPVFMQHGRLQQMIKRISFKALGREIHPYILRHSRLTSMTLKGVQDSVLKKFAGHSATGRALATYQKLIDSDVKKTMLSLSGITTEETIQEQAFILKVCHKCGQKAPSHAILCTSCGGKLDPNMQLLKENVVRDTNNKTIENFLFYLNDNPKIAKRLDKFLSKVMQNKD